MLSIIGYMLCDRRFALGFPPFFGILPFLVISLIFEISNNFYFFKWHFQESINYYQSWNFILIIYDRPKCEASRTSEFLGKERAIKAKVNQHPPAHHPLDCLLWLSCGWISTKLILGFTLVTNYVGNRSRI